MGGKQSPTEEVSPWDNGKGAGGSGGDQTDKSALAAAAVPHSSPPPVPMVVGFHALLKAKDDTFDERLSIASALTPIQVLLYWANMHLDAAYSALHRQHHQHHHEGGNEGSVDALGMGNGANGEHGGRGASGGAGGRRKLLVTSLNDAELSSGRHYVALVLRLLTLNPPVRGASRAADRAKLMQELLTLHRAGQESAGHGSGSSSGGGGGNGKGGGGAGGAGGLRRFKSTRFREDSANSRERMRCVLQALRALGMDGAIAQKCFNPVMLTTSAAQRGNTEGATQGQVHYAFLSLIFANSASLHVQVGRENRART